MSSARESVTMATSRTLKPVDVYDIATDIGREFEAIIDSFGAGALTNLVPKVSHPAYSRCPCALAVC